MKRIIFTICLFLLQFSNAQDNNDVLLSVDNNDYTVEEFLHVYNKNRDLAEKIDPKSVDEYMDLFVNFKLKVLEAESKGYADEKSFKREFAGYKEQIAKNFLYNKELEDKFIEEAYERLQHQVRASHILINVDKKATPKDTLYAFSRAMNVLEKLNKGEDFSAVAKKYSEDPSVKKNNGDLGYFSVLQMVYPFETAVYSGKVGEFVGPIRTQFGYHIVHITDKRKNPGKRKVSHILLRRKKNSDNADLPKKMDEIYNELKAGKDFGEIAKLYSDDKRTASYGGELPAIARNGQMVKEFEDKVFGLKKEGDYTKPFETIYGWHIIKLKEIDEIGSFDFEKKQLKRKIANNDRTKAKDAEMIANLQKEYNYHYHTEALEEVKKEVLTKGFMKNEYEASDKFSKNILSFADQNFSQAEFLDFLHASNRVPAFQKNKNLFVLVKLKEWGHQKLMNYEKSQLSRKYPAYRFLIQEYKDGMLLYEISNKEIWQKALTDSLGLDNFYATNSAKYQWKDRVEVDIFTCKSKKVAKAARKLAKKSMSLKDIESKLNEKSALNVDIKEGVYEKGQSKVLDQFTFKKGISSVKKINDKYCFVNIEKTLPKGQKSLEEAKGNVVSDYQKLLEKNWIDELKAKYKVKVHTDIFKQLKASLSK